MKLFGFQCDNCGVRSADKPKGKWVQVCSLSIRDNGDAWGLLSDGLHYCSRECLKESIDTKWK